MGGISGALDNPQLQTAINYRPQQPGQVPQQPGQPQVPFQSIPGVYPGMGYPAPQPGQPQVQQRDPQKPMFPGMGYPYAGTNGGPRPGYLPFNTAGPGAPPPGFGQQLSNGTYANQMPLDTSRQAYDKMMALTSYGPGGAPSYEQFVQLQMPQVLPQKPMYPGMGYPQQPQPYRGTLMTPEMMQQKVAQYGSQQISPMPAQGGVQLPNYGEAFGGQDPTYGAKIHSAMNPQQVQAAIAEAKARQGIPQQPLQAVQSVLQYQPQGPQLPFNPQQRGAFPGMPMNPARPPQGPQQRGLGGLQMNKFRNRLG